MKIIQVCQNYFPDIGGIATHVKELSEMLVKLGHDVEVVCADPSGKLPKNDVINGVKITRFWVFAPGDAYYFSPDMFFYLREQEYDVMHAHNYHSFPALFAALAKKKKFIFTPHSFGFSKSVSIFKRVLHRIYKPIGSYIFKSADSVISIAPFEMKWLKETFNIPESKLILMPLPIKSVRSSPRKIRGNIIKIGYFGRLSAEKNINVLISAYGLVRLKRPDSGLFIAGDGPLRQEAEEFGKSFEGVHFVGRLLDDKLDDFIDDLDVFVLCSKFEVSPRAILEAMSHGLPVVTTPVGELPQIFQDGIHCLFSEKENPEDTAQKILQLLNNEDLASRIAQAGKVLVQNRYDINKVIHQYVKIYSE